MGDSQEKYEPAKHQWDAPVIINENGKSMWDEWKGESNDRQSNYQEGKLRQQMKFDSEKNNIRHPAYVMDDEKS